MVFSLAVIFSIVYLFFPSNSISLQNFEVDLQFNGNNAYSYVQDQLDIGFRIPGTQEREDCANFFISKFEQIDSNFTYIFHNFTIDLTECQNVLFKLNEHESNIVILGTHYDSRTKATKDPILANRDSPVPGANDGASGSAILIELARVLYDQRANLTCQIWFLFFDAEDQGEDNAYGIDDWGWCEGSQEFVSEINNFYNSATETLDCMILLDMVGGEGLRFINEQYSTSSLLDELFAIGRQLGFTSQFPSNPDSASIIDDHRAFINNGIPSADLIINFWNNPEWSYHHTTQDDITHISNSSLDVTGKTVEQFMHNNYNKDPNNQYQGNFPWNEDINVMDNETKITIILVIAIVGVIVVILIVSRGVSKEKNKLNEGKNLLSTS